MKTPERTKLQIFLNKLCKTLHTIPGNKILRITYDEINYEFDGVPTLTIYLHGMNSVVIFLEEKNELSMLSKVTAFLMNEKEREE